MIKWKKVYVTSFGKRILVEYRYTDAANRITGQIVPRYLKDGFNGIAKRDHDHATVVSSQWTSWKLSHVKDSVEAEIAYLKKFTFPDKT